jgi:hypothetical protein
MIPVAILTIGAMTALLPKHAQALAIAARGFVFLFGSMALSMLLVHRKAK